MSPALSTGIAPSKAASAARPPPRSTLIAPRPFHHELGDAAADAAAAEVLRLGPERDVPGHDRAEEQLVGDGQMVSGEDRTAGGRDVLQALDVRPPAELHHITDGVFADRVEQRQRVPPAGTAENSGGGVRLSEAAAETSWRAGRQARHLPSNAANPEPGGASTGPGGAVNVVLQSETPLPVAQIDPAGHRYARRCVPRRSAGSPRPVKRSRPAARARTPCSGRTSRRGRSGPNAPACAGPETNSQNGREVLHRRPRRVVVVRGGVVHVGGQEHDPGHARAGAPPAAPGRTPARGPSARPGHPAPRPPARPRRPARRCPAAGRWR